MYKIIGADQKEYGPISADQIRQWISEGRVNGQTQACAEGSQVWKPLEKFPEFGFTAAPAAIPPAPTGPPLSTQEVLARDYSLDIMSCVSRAWALLKDNFGTVFVTFLLFIVLVVAAFMAIGMILVAAGVNQLPLEKQVYLRPINIIFGSLVLGPTLGGVYHVYLSLLRGQYASAGDLFNGFRSFQDLFLSRLIFGVVNTACMLPYMIMSTAKMAPYFNELQKHPPTVMTPEQLHEIVSVLVSAYLPSWPYFLIGMVVSLYFYVNWIFVTPLIVDRRAGFWTAIVTSWKIAHKHWFQIFGLVVLLSLLNIAGLCACCIGWLVTVPLGMIAICYAYEDIFGRKAA